MSLTEHEIMQRALRLAARGLYTTEPNPRVGCVLVKNNEVIAEGWHRQAGQAHAEVVALESAGEDAKGSTAYVTLEPCCHTGKTGPCTDALINAGVSKVIAAMTDPNPLVAGKGLEKLEHKGISTSSGLLENAARQLNPGFISRMEKGRPYVRLKMAMSLDGRTAMASGESQWITGEAARRDVQKLRARSSAILTGIGTVLHDNPRLDVRIDAAELGVEEGVKINAPLRVVLDSRGRLPADANLLSTSGKVLQVTSNSVAASADCDHLAVESTQHGLDMKEVLTALAAREVNELHVECGAVLAGSLLSQALVDELVLYVAPHIMGDNARGLFNLPGLEQMKDRVDLDINDTRMVGKDMRITATFNYQG